MTVNTAIVGVGSTPYYKRGQSLPQTSMELACRAVIAAADDAGLDVADIDGFAYFAGLWDTGIMAQLLGIPKVRFSAAMTGGGSGSAGSVGLASAAVQSGLASVVVSLKSIQSTARFGSTYGSGVGPEADFMVPFGAFAPGHYFSMMARRHMHTYGTTREHFAEVCMAQRFHASRRSTSLMRDLLTLDDYFAARMISDPFCLFDYTLESDGAVAVITTSMERARDLRQKPARILGNVMGGDGNWGRGYVWQGMPEDLYTTAGQGELAARLYGEAGVTAADIDVALFYDHFSATVLTQLEDWGFCAVGESGSFVADGNIRWPNGSIPVNTHGGHLSEAYIIGMTHVKEAVEQVRGTAVNQVDNAELALVTGGPSILPGSAILLSS